MAVNDDLADDAVLRSVRSMRAANGIWRELLPILRRAERDLLKKIEQGAPRTISSRRAQTLLRDVRRLIDGGAEEFIARLEGRGKELAEIEEAAALKSLENRVPLAIDWVRPSGLLLEAVALTQPFEGALLRDHLSKWSDDTVFAMQAEIRTAIIEGEGIEPMQRRLRRVADIKINHARALSRTYTSHVVNAARAKLYEENKDVIAKEQWVATLDDRTCIRCAVLDNKIFDVGKGTQAPLHMSCLPGDSLVTPCGDISRVSKRWFEGDLVVIETASGRKLTITPNHLIATRRGWIEAKSVNTSDQVVCNSGSQRARFVYNLSDNRKARIEDIAKSFLGSRGVVASEVPVSAPDFHGDGAKSKVAIVGTNGSLLLQDKPAIASQQKEFAFNPGNALRSVFERFGAPAKFLERRLAASAGLICGLGERLSLRWRRAVHSSILLFAGVPQRHAVLAQNQFYLGAYKAKPVCDACNANAGKIKALNFGKPLPSLFKFFDVRQRATSNRDALFFEDGPDGLPIDAKTFRDRVHRQAGLVKFDNVIAVSIKKNFCGHVYNLETTKNIYLAQGIIVHNCRCVRVPLTRAAEALAERGIVGTRAARNADGMTGEVPANMAFPDWLRRQAEATQREVLGERRFDLFKNGTPIDKFVNDENEIITLDKLRV